MNINKPSQDITTSWKYFPNINTLLRYLEIENLVELSKCSKFYRKQLEKRVLENLKLGYWYHNISEIYEGLKETRKIEKISELLKSDLGPKLKLVHSVNLDCGVSREFSESFVKLLPNVKTLRFDAFNGCDFECGCGGDCQQGLITALSCMRHLEHVEVEFEGMPKKNIRTKEKIFPKSLKLLNINLHRSYEIYENENLNFYDIIDASYINLHTLTIVSNRMLQNLSTRIPNLQNVKIEIDLDESKFINFLEANPQLRKLDTIMGNYNQEMFNTILSSKHLEHWFIGSRCWEDEQINSLPSNYSVKHLEFYYDVPPPIALKIINACKGLKTLDLSCYEYHLNSLEWSKLERRINVLNLSYDIHIPSRIKEIDALRQFNSIHIENRYDPNDDLIKDLFDQINRFKLINYEHITYISKSLILKLINKTD